MGKKTKVRPQKPDREKVPTRRPLHKRTLPAATPVCRLHTQRHPLPDSEPESSPVSEAGGNRAKARRKKRAGTTRTQRTRGSDRFDATPPVCRLHTQRCPLPDSEPESSPVSEAGGNRAKARRKKRTGTTRTQRTRGSDRFDATPPACRLHTQRCPLPDSEPESSPVSEAGGNRAKARRKKRTGTTRTQRTRGSDRFDATPPACGSRQPGGAVQ
jgi:hypothetical protein